MRRVVRQCHRVCKKCQSNLTRVISYQWFAPMISLSGVFSRWLQCLRMALATFPGHICRPELTALFLIALGVGSSASEKVKVSWSCGRVATQLRCGKRPALGSLASEKVKVSWSCGRVATQLRCGKRPALGSSASEEVKVSWSCGRVATQLRCGKRPALGKSIQIFV